MGWGWLGGQQGRAQVDKQTESHGVAHANSLLIPQTHPPGDAVVWARIYGHEQSIPSLCPSSRSAFPGAETDCCISFGMPPSTDGGLLSFHFPFLGFPPATLGEVDRAERKKQKKTLCQLCSSSTHQVPHEGSGPSHNTPAGRAAMAAEQHPRVVPAVFYSLLQGTCLGQTGTSRI